MKINAIEQLNRILGEIDEKLQLLESSPNRAFVLIEYETLDLFHWFNICFKQFWEEFDRRSASQLLMFLKFTKRFSEQSNKYVALFREQIDYLESVLDFEYQSVKELPPVVFGEDDSPEVIGYYQEQFKNEKDDDGKPLYEIEIDSDTNFEVIDGKDVPVTFCIFRNKKINKGHYSALLAMYQSLDSIFKLMCVVCSYPDELIYGYKPTTDDIIAALDSELRQYAREIGKKVERDLKVAAQRLKPSRNSSLNSDVWGNVMDEEDDLFELVKNNHLKTSNDKRFEHIFEDERKLLTDNNDLLQKIQTACLDEELFDIRLAVENHSLLSSLNADNLDLFYERVLRRNIIHREMFPEQLKMKYNLWLNPPQEPQAEGVEDDDLKLDDARQSKLDEIIKIMQKGNWKQPATANNIALLLNTVCGRNLSALDAGDKSECEQVWAYIEGGGGDRMKVVPANLAGFFSEENLLAGTPLEISNNLFGKNCKQTNNINKGKGKPNNSIAKFEAIKPFLRKYINKIIRKQ